MLDEEHRQKMAAMAKNKKKGPSEKAIKMLKDIVKKKISQLPSLK
jgi:hypothetical protein